MEYYERGINLVVVRSVEYYERGINLVVVRSTRMMMPMWMAYLDKFNIPCNRNSEHRNALLQFTCIRKLQTII
jgi:hypothetical protein